MSLGNALLWSIGGLGEACKDCTGFLIMHCLASSPRHQPPGPRQHHAQFSSSATSLGAPDQKRLHAPTQATCTTSRFEPSGHATSTAAFSQYRPNGKTQCFGFDAAPNRLWTSAPSVNAPLLSISSVVGPPMSHLCHQLVVSQFHTWLVLLSFSVVSRHLHRPQHICATDCHQW